MSDEERRVPRPKAKREDILDKAKHLVSADRAEMYGDAYDNFFNIARLWNAYLATPAMISAHDVGLMLALVKIARTKAPEKHDDNYVDIAGYAALAAEMK